MPGREASIHSEPPDGRQFSSDWFSEHINLWQEQLDQLKGRPNLHFLEIGAFEGRATLWMLENILTHPSSRVTCIDPFEETYVYRKNNPCYEQRFDNNTSGYSEKVIKLKGYSRDLLRRMTGSYDLIYLDGSHIAIDVLEDAVLSWPLVSENGLIVFDDYLLKKEAEEEKNPQIAIDSFLSVYRNRYDLVHKGKQVWIRKRET